MVDASYILFDALLARYPYTPNTAAEQETLRRFQAAKTSPIPKELRHTCFELTDSLDILSHYKAHHAFLLGLDWGLTLSRELDDA